MIGWFLIVAPGEARDIKFRRHSLHSPADGIRAYSVIVGDEAWGFVYYGDHQQWNGWQAFSYNYSTPKYATSEEALKALLPPESEPADFKSEKSLQKVKGFLTRRAAATYIIKHWGYWESN
ncbi:hypothetical protein [Streptomyces sp. NPDC051572]|jgi:hypothetical protein|uniref:hypothetical protein n=1 Tax=Streptomyces sp. NPDC051572 TaxID=3155802 RepID=UPI00344E3E7B